MTVAFFADGVDPNNPDSSTRRLGPQGQHVLSPIRLRRGWAQSLTNGAEAFGDAGSIAAQGNQIYDLIRLPELVSPGPRSLPDTYPRTMAPGASLMGFNSLDELSCASRQLWRPSNTRSTMAPTSSVSHGFYPVPDAGEIQCHRRQSRRRTRRHGRLYRPATMPGRLERSRRRPQIPMSLRPVRQPSSRRMRSYLAPRLWAPAVMLR